jgi:hypothetical protein
VTFLALIALLAAEPEKTKVAVLDIEAVNVDPAVARAFSEAYASAIHELGCCAVTTRAEISALLGFEKEKQLLGCSDNVSCMTEIGGALGVEKLAVGTLSRVEGLYLLTLKLIDTRAAKTEGRFSNRADAVAPLLESVDRGVALIFKEVIAAAPSAEPELGDIEPARTQKAPEEPALELPGTEPPPAEPELAPLQPIATEAAVPAPATAAPEPPSSPQRPWKPGPVGIAALGAGALAGAAGAYFGVAALDATRDAIWATRRDAFDAAKARAQSNAGIATGAFVAAGVAGAAGAVMLVIGF